MDKKIILTKLIESLNLELIEVESAAKSTKDLVTADDLKSEGKYDTRAIEASYLASAQLKRVEEIKTDIQMLEDIELIDAEKVQMGSLVLIEFKGQQRYYFLTTTSGGTMLMVDGNPVLVISVFSPIGNEALGLGAGESFEVETPKEMRTYKIIKVS
ncbi:MAG: GreA/GreB family elongation factor [Bacteriovorax sp.]|nr:GreA/GreB family elongation factor [Bacteriovorax sp.]